MQRSLSLRRFQAVGLPVKPHLRRVFISSLVPLIGGGATLPAVAGVQRQTLEFSTTGQSIWSKGAAVDLSIDEFFGVEWNESFPRILDEDIDLGPIGDASFELSATTSGRFGVDFFLEFNSGSVDANLPYDVGFDFNRADMEPGATATIRTFANLKDNASFSTISPKFEIFSDLVFELNASVSGNGSLDTPFGDTSGSFSRTLLNVNEGLELFAVNRDGDLMIRLLEGSEKAGNVSGANAQKQLQQAAAGEATEFVEAKLETKLPKIPNFFAPLQIDSPPPIVLNAKFPNVDAAGTKQGDALASNAVDEFVTLEVDVDSIASEIIKPLPDLGVAATIEDANGVVVVDASADLVALNFGDKENPVKLSLIQDIEITPSLTVTLNFNQPVRYSADGGVTFTPMPQMQLPNLPVGDDFQVILPADDSTPLEITPTFSITAMVDNDTALDLDLAASLAVLQASLEVDVAGEEILDVSIPPLLSGGCVAGDCSFNGPGGVDLGGFDIPDPAALQIPIPDFELGGFENASGDVLVLDTRDAVWIGEVDNNGRDDWGTAHAWENAVVGDDGRDVVLDIANVPGRTSTTIVIQDGESFTIDDLTISEGVTVEIANGTLRQIRDARDPGSPDRAFDNQGTVRVFKNDDLFVDDLLIGAKLITGGGTIEIAGGDVTINPEIDGNVVETIPIDQVIEGHGEINFRSGVIYQFLGDSTVAADGGELSVTGIAENLTLTARNNSTLRLSAGFFLIDGELRSEGTGVVTGSAFTLIDSVVSSANITTDFAGTINFGEAGESSAVDFTNNGTVTTDFIRIRSNAATVDGVGSVVFKQSLDEFGADAPSLTIGAGQDWSGQGVAQNFDLANHGRFGVFDNGQLDVRMGLFVNDGILSANGGTLNLIVGTYDFRNGTVKSSGGTVDIIGDPSFSLKGAITVKTDGSPGGLWDARSGAIRFGDMDEQWPGLATDFTLDQAEVWLGPNGDIQLGDIEFLPAGQDPIVTPFVSIRQFIQRIGPNGVLRVLDGANYQPAASGATPAVNGIDLEGVIELEGGVMTLTSGNPSTNGDLNIQGTGHFLGFGRLEADVVNNGLIEAVGGPLTIDGAAQGEGEYYVHSGSEINILSLSTLGMGSQVTVDAKTQPAAFRINAQVDRFSGMSVALMGADSAFGVANNLSLEDTLQEIDDSHFNLSHGRAFDGQQSVTLNGDSPLALDDATYQSPEGLTVNGTSAVELKNDSTLDLGGVLTINTPVGHAALSGSGLVRATTIDSAGLIDVHGTILRFEDSSIDQSRGGEILVGENLVNGQLGILGLSNVTINEGLLYVKEGGIVTGSGQLNDVLVLVDGAVIASQGDSINIVGGTIENSNTIKAQAGGELSFQFVEIANADSVIEINAVDNDPTVDSTLTLSNASISQGSLDLISAPPGTGATDSAAVLRGDGRIVGTAITLDRSARIEAGDGETAGTLILDLLGATLDNRGTLTTADQGGTLKLLNGEIAGGGLIEARAGGRVEISNLDLRNATFSTIGDGVIADLATSTFANLNIDGHFEVFGDVTFDGFANNKDGAVVTNTAGGTLNNLGEFNNRPGSTLINYGETVNSGEFNINTAAQVSGTGTYTQTAGTTTVGGSFKQSQIHLSGGALALEAIDDTFDPINATDTATLAGTLDVTLRDGFTPMPGDVLTILTAGELLGGFDDYTGDVFVVGADLALVPVADHNTDEVTLVVTAPGDANLDFTVDAADLNTLALNWQQSVTGWDKADFNNDGMVNAADLNLLALSWQFGVNPPSLASLEDAFAEALAATVPEPGTLAILVAGGLAMGRRHRGTQMIKW